MSGNFVKECFRKPCEMTGGYYIGGGLYVCWLHACADEHLFGLVAGKPLVVLNPTFSADPDEVSA
jgi:hypothetical protein